MHQSIHVEQIISDDVAGEIERLEAERGRALINADWAALASILADDLVHIHATGLIDDKAQYLEGVRTKMDFIEFARVSFSVRCYGEVAIATGILDQTIQLRGQDNVLQVRAATTQTWVRRDDRWRQNSFQATRIS